MKNLATEIFKIFCSRDTSQLLQTDFGDLVVTYDIRLLDEFDDEERGCLEYHADATSVIFINEAFAETDEEKLLIFLHEFSHFVAISKGRDFIDYHEDELSTHLAAQKLSEFLSMKEECSGDILFHLTKVGDDEKIQMISRQSDCIVEIIKRYFHSLVGEKYDMDMSKFKSL